jgi:spore germination protein GerM
MKTSASLALLLLIVVTSIGQTAKTTTVKLFFPNSKMDKSDCAVKVFPVTRAIPQTVSIARATLQQLFAGPTADEQAKGYYSDFSDETKTLLISVNVKNQAAYVNLKDLTTSTTKLGNFTTTCGSSNFFGQVESTLKQFPSIKKVYFAFEGDPAYFYDWIQIGECPKALKKCDASNFVK